MDNFLHSKVQTLLYYFRVLNAFYFDSHFSGLTRVQMRIVSRFVISQSASTGNENERKNKAFDKKKHVLRWWAIHPFVAAKIIVVVNI